MFPGIMASQNIQYFNTVPTSEPHSESPASPLQGPNGVRFSFVLAFDTAITRSPSNPYRGNTNYLDCI